MKEKPMRKEPLITSVSMFKVPGDDFAWKAVAIKTQGEEFIAQEDICKPNIRAIVEEQFKVYIARNLFKR